MTRSIITGTFALGLAGSLLAQPPTAPAPAAAEKSTAAAPEKAEKAAAPKLTPEQLKTESSFALGLRTGGEFNQQFGRFGITLADVDSASFLKGFLAGAKGGKPEVDDEKLQAAMEQLGQMLQQRETAIAAKNLEEGNKFLETNGKREGVITTKSGLQYEVINKGGAEKYVAPKDDKAAEKQFVVNYKGTLVDGTVFDASPEGQPVPLSLMVVDGFKEALTTMPIGAKWKLFIPSKLGYGEERRSAELAPNSTLIFELELVKIEDAPKSQGGMPFPGQMPPGE
ncbi:MAG: FKBP-type peptidyl-prolyl cis-trans isomerase N-terminal domain-containing protein [Verrucomicrobiota bacterium]